MNWTSATWVITRVVRDIALNGTGLYLIIRQSFSPQPSVELLMAGLALAGIGASFHVGALVSGHIGGPSSSSSSPESSSPSSSSPGRGERQ